MAEDRTKIIKKETVTKEGRQVLTPGGYVRSSLGDLVVETAEGDQFVCKPENFSKLYVEAK